MHSSYLSRYLLALLLNDYYSSKLFVGLTEEVTSSVKTTNSLQKMGMKKTGFKREACWFVTLLQRHCLVSYLSGCEGVR